jgi:hypothetical protein
VLRGIAAILTKIAPVLANILTILPAVAPVAA